MGGCISRADDTERANNENGVNLLANGNKKLVPFSSYKWKSDVPMTKEDVIKKREEFWLTSPSYDGRQEIWQALKACCETDSLDLAQAIIDSAGISVPTGSLVDGCYDELGNQYVLPNFCITDPSNLVESDGEATKPLLNSGEANTSISNEDSFSTQSESDDGKEDSQNKGKAETANAANSPKSETHVGKSHFIVNDQGTLITTHAVEAGGEEALEKEENIAMTFRLSTNKDIKIIFNKKDTVKTIHHCIIKHQNLDPHKTILRIILKGKILGDNTILSEPLLSSSINIIQVFITQKV